MSGIVQIFFEVVLKDVGNVRKFIFGMLLQTTEGVVMIVLVVRNMDTSLINLLAFT